MLQKKKTTKRTGSKLSSYSAQAVTESLSGNGKMDRQGKMKSLLLLAEYSGHTNWVIKSYNNNIQNL